MNLNEQINLAIQHLPFYISISLPVVLFATVLVSWLKKKYRIKTPYTRKIFHFIIFTSSGIFQYLYGLSAVLVFGSIVFGMVLIALYKSDGFSFYEALARPTDAPHRSKFIVLPLFATAIGGLLSNVFFGQFAFIGYLVGGWGDAIGEPVGTKWGKHKYSVPTLFGVRAYRSYEGSFAVFLVSYLALILSFLLLGKTLIWSLLIGLLVAIICTLTEAFSSHGLDNLTVQLMASALAYFFI